jgi:hypothetical protein
METRATAYTASRANAVTAIRAVAVCQALLSALSKSQSESFTSSQGFKPYPQLNRFQPA